MKARAKSAEPAHLETEEAETAAAKPTPVATPRARSKPLNAIEPTQDAKALAQASSGSASQRRTGNGTQFVLDVLSGKIGQGDAAPKYQRTPTSEERREWVASLLTGEQLPMPSSREYAELKLANAKSEYSKIRAESEALKAERTALEAKVEKDPKDAAASARLSEVQELFANAIVRAMHQYSKVTEWTDELAKFDA